MIPIQKLNAVDALQPSEEGCNLTMVKGVELGPAGAPSIGCFETSKECLLGEDRRASRFDLA
jgi:hypothetical protein